MGGEIIELLLSKRAGVVKLADALDSKSSGA